MILVRFFEFEIPTRTRGEMIGISNSPHQDGSGDQSSRRATLGELRDQFAERTVRWDLDTYVSRRMAYNHYFGAKAGTAPKKA